MSAPPELETVLVERNTLEIEVSRLRSALAGSHAGPGWQPMETAPKDGTEILAAVFVHKNGKPWGWERHVIAYDDEAGDVDADFDHGWEWDTYTHWMPLPPGPDAAPHAGEEGRDDG